MYFASTFEAAGQQQQNSETVTTLTKFFCQLPL